MSQSYESLLERLREVATYTSVGAVLGWDQETYMPPGAAPFRAEQLALMARLGHERFIADELGEWLERCEADEELLADPARAANVRETRRDYDRARKLPTDLVAEMTETSSRSLEAWRGARESSRFELLEPWLTLQVELNRRKAECYGAPASGELYDALVEDFEPGMHAGEIERLFAPLRSESVALLERVRESTAGPDDALDRVELPIDAQVRFNEAILGELGFDLQRGRLDVSSHPFSTGIAPGDTRITTRYKKTLFADALGSTMHETGHALYEQGLPRDEAFGQPLAESISLGIHESQSRLWENHVGRSRAFWRWAAPRARAHFAPALDAFDDEAMYRAVNRIAPHLIRVESDELTYNLHIMLRFDLERAMIAGDLAVADLPSAWNERIRADLGLEVPDDRRGCLQDIHWPMGSFGYFPTYSLGNLYGAQLWESLTAAVGDVDAQMERGEFGGVLDWLREQVHAVGRRVSAPELCRRLTGRPLDHAALVRHLGGKLAEVYGVATPIAR